MELDFELDEVEDAEGAEDEEIAVARKKAALLVGTL